MPYVMRMSTDSDIIQTNLSPSWGGITANYQWVQISNGGLNIPSNSEIVVISHGNNCQIGNHKSGIVDIDAEMFLFHVHNNMLHGAAPLSIYISACGKSIAGFAASVKLTAEKNEIWSNTTIFGHCDLISGDVPPKNDIRWVPIY